MTPEELGAALSRRLPGPLVAGPEPLRGGLLNLTWRVRYRGGSLVAKHAPPHVAAAPEVPLDPARLDFEARALALFAPDGRLSDLCREEVRPPRPAGFDRDTSLLLMEDLGDPPQLRDALTGGLATPRRTGLALGTFVGRLHARTFGDATLASEFDNRPIQRSRLSVQYCEAAPRLSRAGIPRAQALGARAEELGRRLCQPGRCLTMGDLWPPSILVTPEGLRLIDWEFCHFGEPAQDLAHLAAHLWMAAHRAPSAEAARRARSCWSGFVEGYRTGAGPRVGDLLDARTRADAAVHWAAEVLARTAPPFQEGYLYSGLPLGAAPLREAVGRAAARLSEPEAVAVDDLV